MRVDAAPTGDRALGERVAAGGFPEAVSRTDGARRAAWFDSYLGTLLARDVRDLAAVEGLARLPDILRLLAARTGSLQNAAELARSSGLPQTTLKRYLALLEGVFLVARLPAWSSNLGKRLVKSPKLHLLDPGIAAHLRGESTDGPSTPGGALLETFVFAELEKQAAWSRARTRLHHYRSHSGSEVDFVLEDAAGRCVGIEVKSAATVRGSDFAGLEDLARALGDRFVRGALLYRGTEVLPFGPRMTALPVEALWRGTAA